MVASAFYNMARMTSATTGTGTLTLGSAVSSFLTFAASGVPNGATVSYVIEDGVNRENGQGVYTTSGTTLTRATIFNSTNSNAAISCSGSQQVYITALASDIVSLAVSNTWSALQTFSAGVAITGSNAGNVLTATISGAPLNIVLTNYGTLNQAYPSYYAYAAGGTSGSPSAVLNGDALAGFYGYGWTSAAAWSITNVGLEFVASENWTGTANGGQYWFYASPNGLAANSIVCTLTGNGALTLGVLNSLGTLTGGSSYTTGTYTNVPLTTVSGAGSNAQATIVVAGGAVTSVTITKSGGTPSGGTAYTAGSVLSALASNIGGTGSGFQITVANITALGGALGNGASGQLVLNSAFGGSPIAIQNSSGTGNGNYTLFLPQTMGAANTVLMSQGLGNYLTWTSNTITLGSTALALGATVTSVSGLTLSAPTLSGTIGGTSTATGLTAGIANALASATTTVSVSAATAPSAGQVLMASSSTLASWVVPSYITANQTLTTGTTATAVMGQFVGWNSSTTGGKTTTLPSPTGSFKLVVVSDLQTTGSLQAALNPITCTPSSGSIIGPAIINDNNGALVFLDVASGTWMSI